MSVVETLPELRELKRRIADYIATRVPQLAKSYPYEPTNLQGLPCTTLLSRRYDAAQAETGPHDDMTYEFRLRVYSQLDNYERAQDELDELIPQILDVPRHHSTMEGDVDFLIFYDPGAEPTFSKDDGWVFKDLVARIQRTEL